MPLRRGGGWIVAVPGAHGQHAAGRLAGNRFASRTAQAYGLWWWNLKVHTLWWWDLRVHTLW